MGWKNEKSTIFIKKLMLYVFHVKKKTDICIVKLMVMESFRLGCNNT